MGDEVKGSEILAILMGATAWPKAQKLNVDEAKFNINPFNASKAFVLEYLSSERGLRLPSENIRDLFDSESSPYELKKNVEEFLQERKSKLKTITDVIFYYVGHGDYFENSGYYIATRHLDTNDINNTGFDISNITSALLDKAGSSRHILIIDACYAAGAQIAYRQDITNTAEVINKITKKHKPRLGTALFCAAGPRAFAKTLPGQEFTMFTGAFAKAIRQRDDQTDNLISLRELGEEMQAIIRDEYGSGGVLPEIHTPIADDGDIATVQLFPRFRDLAVGASIEQLAATVDTVHSKVEEISQTLNDQASAISTLKERIRLLESKIQLPDASARARLRKRPKDEWTPVRREMITRYFEAKRNSTIAICSSLYLYFPQILLSFKFFQEYKIIHNLSLIQSMLSVLFSLVIFINFINNYRHGLSYFYGGIDTDEEEPDYNIYHVAKYERYTRISGIIFIYKKIILSFVFIITYAAVFGIKDILMNAASFWIIR